MRSRRRWAAVLCLATAACFHQVVQTGLAVGPTPIDKPFASTFVFGLASASEIAVRSDCPGSADVTEMEQGLVNGLGAGLTLGIYSPQQVRATCASRSAAIPSGALEVTIPAAATEAAGPPSPRRMIGTPP